MIARYLPTVILAGALALFVWWVMDLRAQNAALRTQSAAQAAQIVTLTTEAALAREAAQIAQKERDRAAVNAAKYQTIRDAFRKGDFNAPLPDDFRHLVGCLLRYSATGAASADCPARPR